jgi:nucleotide-binding universal stress UspA family protein
MSGPIVLGFDGTEGARAAVAEVARIAPLLHAEVVVAFGYEASPVGGEVGDLATTLHERGERVTAEAVELLAAAGVTATPAVVPGRIAESLANLADSVDAQMLVVGSYGQRTLTSLLLGSTPNKLLHLSHRPVLVVRG